MKLSFYLDESGNSGDALFQEGNNNPIVDQPSFALAGIGVAQTNDLACIVHDLKKKYRVQANDLKASHVFSKKPKFIQELLEAIIIHKFPLFIELMDKRYFVATNIVSFYIATSYLVCESLQDPIFASLARKLATLIADEFGDIVLIKYSQMCRFPSKDSFIQFSRSFYQECIIAINRGIEGKEFLSMLAEMIAMDLEEIQSGELDESMVKRFIPPSDRNKRGEIIAMLPHVNAFTNLYARINNFVRKNIQFEIIHDEQAHFDEILGFWERSLRTNQFADKLGTYWNRDVDFTFTERESFKFAKSDVCYGIQVADVIAGFCTRYFKQVQADKVDIGHSYSATINLIRELSESRTGQGLNLVASKASALKFYSAST